MINYTLFIILVYQALTCFLSDFSSLSSDRHASNDFPQMTRRDNTDNRDTRYSNMPSSVSEAICVIVKTDSIFMRISCPDVTPMLFLHHVPATQKAIDLFNQFNNFMLIQLGLNLNK